MMYYTGKGVSQDYVQAHTWINLAVSRATTGEAKYRLARDSLAERMTASQVAEAQRLAREWQPKTWEQLTGQVDFSVDRVTTELPDFRTSFQNKPLPPRACLLCGSCLAGVENHDDDHKFLAHGTGPAAAAEYLTRERFPAQDQEKNPEEVKILRGNPHQVADIGARLTALNLQQ